MSAAELAGALTAYLTEGKGFPPTFRDQLGFLVEAAGGNRPAGRLLGLPESSIRRWLAGAKPRAPRDLTPFLRAYWAGRPRFIEAYNGYASFVGVMDILYSNDERTARTVHFGREVPLRRIQAILRAWEAGADKTVGNNLSRAIKEDYFSLGSDQASLGMVSIGEVREIYTESSVR